MSDMLGGSVIWNLDVDSKKFDDGLKKAGDDVDGLGKHFDSAEKQGKSMAFGLSSSFDNIASGLGTIITGAAGLAVAGSFGFGAMAQAAFKQVSAVENASFALRAYEKDGQKVNNILSQLIKYAQSDMGVLFQREDLFKAASNLRGFGDSAALIVDHVKVLSKGVALGYTNFDELSQIIGRVTQQGTLNAESFDMLAQRGIILDSSLRGVKITSEDLYAALNKALPDSILKGRANTIEGIITRLQSAFRNLGGQLLDVDAKTSQFVKGGLGDTLVKALDSLTQSLKKPEIKKGIADIGSGLASLAKNAIPVLITSFTWIVNNIPSIIAAFASLVAMFAVAKVAAIALAIATAPALIPFYLIAAAAILVVGALTYLQLRFNIFGAAITFVSGLLTGLGTFFVSLWKTIQTTFISGWNAVVQFFTVSIPAFVNSFITFLTQLPSMIVSSVWNNIILGFVNFLGSLVGLAIVGIPRLIATIIGLLIALPNNILNILVSVYNIFVSTWTNISNFITAAVPAIVASVATWINQLPVQIGAALGILLTTFVTGFKNIWSSIVSEISTWPSKLYDWGVNLMKSLADGIKSAIGQIADAFKSGMENAKKLVKGNSPPVEGPFKDIDKWGYNVGNAWVNGMRSAIGDLSLESPTLAQNDSSVSPAPAYAQSGRSGPTINIDNMNIRQQSDITDVSRELAFRIETSSGYIDNG